MQTDVLSDVLRAVRMTGAVYFDFELRSPWVVEAPRSREIVGQVMPGAQRLIEFHLIARGSGWGHAIGDPPERLREGDVLVFPHGDAHVLASAPGLRAAPDMQAFARRSTPLPMFYELGGSGGERARIVCCFLGCDDQPFNPLLDALPSVVHLSSGRSDADAEPLGTLLVMAAKEARSTRAGRENVLARLSELLFVETIRRHLETLPPGAGWLAGLRDPTMARALGALHAEPHQRWTVERLARAVGLSRSVLAQRFTEMIGRPPMQYLALWRMQLASRLLLDRQPIAAVASAVGYESEAAFSRAFKRLVGLPPASWRLVRPSYDLCPGAVPVRDGAALRTLEACSGGTTT
ncbi:MAG TPA: AraC family transcriptional regulator [Vicinamibacterales bacterium]|nr:AraC family transcriptional regulator [Vicinamibacterales bacterium]